MMRYGPQDWDLIPVHWTPGADPRVWKHKACGERLEFPDDQHRCPGSVHALQSDAAEIERLKRIEAAARTLVESGVLVEEGESLKSCLGCGTFNVKRGEGLEHAPDCLYTLVGGEG
jgi:hypothetical protein